MANFNTHLSVALVASATIGMYGITLGVYGVDILFVLLVAGGIGGLLPDIDLENSRISRIGFHWASLFIASYMAILYATFYQPPIVQTLILWVVAYAILRYGVFALFSRLTRHRGMVHSLPYMAVLSLIFVYLVYYFLPSGKLAWLFGGFVFFGSIVHLLLDELYSVNIYGLRLKKSFGSAFKFVSKKQLPHYVLLYALLFVLYVFAPAKNELSFLLTQLSQG